ncbi:hypothetical protein HZS_5022 [Henneguya salminicola]|nr:hypothetical protein HZS_5022 [Henneguya salminicola]
MEVDKNDLMADEEVLRKRLVNDNEGNGEEKRINTFIKNYLSFLLRDISDIEETEASYRKLKISLDQFEYNWKKQVDVNYLLDEDQNDHSQSINKFRQMIESARLEIQCKRNELLEAKSVNRLRQEYNILRQNLKKYQDPQEINESIACLDAQKKELTQKLDQFNQKLESYKNEYQVFMCSIMSLKDRLQN